MSSLQDFIAGGVAGSISRLLLSPLDRHKLRLQVESSYHRAHCTSESLRSAWNGGGINLLRGFLYSGVQLSVYSHMQQHSECHSLIVGATAGVSAVLLTQPLDVIRIKLMAHPTSVTLDSARKLGMIDWKQCYKGLTPTLCSVIPFISMNLGMVAWWSRQKPETPLWFVGGISSLAAQTVCYPLDLISKRWVAKGRGSESSVREMVRSLYQHEGVRAFYRGYVINAIKQVPHGAIRWGVYSSLSSSRVLSLQNNTPNL